MAGRQTDLFSLLAGEVDRGGAPRVETFEASPGARGIDKASDAWAAREAERPHFYRCADCLTVVCCDERPASRATRQEDRLRCGVCGGLEEYMGQAGKQPGRLTRTSVESVCDDRCTSARGPHCECRCGGRNHGSGRWVLVTRDVGKAPTVTPRSGREVATAKARADEYRAAYSAARARLGWVWGLADRKQAGEHLSDAEFRRYLDGRRHVRALHAAVDARTHKGRLAKLAKVGA